MTPQTLLAVLGTPEIIIIAVVVVLLFGATQLPKLARSIGASVRELRKGMKEGESDQESGEETDAKGK